MNDLKKLSDDGFIAKTSQLVAQERRLLSELLWHLKEIENRRLHLVRGFPSLFEYCTRQLGYSEGSAARRIQAMRLLKEMPELERPITEGALNLSHLNSFHHFLKREKKDHHKVYTKADKTRLLEKLMSTSKRDAEKFLATISPVQVPTEQERVISSSLTEVKLTLNDEQMEKFKRLKEHYSHVNPEMGYSELFERLADQVLKKLEPKKFESKKFNPESPDPKKVDPKKIKTAHGSGERAMSEPGVRPGSCMEPAFNAQSNALSDRDPTPPVELKVQPSPQTRAKQIQKTTQTRYVPRAHQIPKEHCTYQDPTTGRICGSRHQLEWDHIQPYAKRGPNERQNLRVRCRQHNLLHATQSFGEAKMEKYVWK